MEKQKDKFIVTEEMIAKATNYIPFAEKIAIVSELAQSCLEPVVKTSQSMETQMQLPIPQFYRERSGAKQYFLVYYFLTKYFHFDIRAEYWDYEQFDNYASSHIFNQLERFKSSGQEVKNKVFDILHDYKTLKIMLETEIFNLKESRNNTFERIQDSISLFASPENIEKIKDYLQKTIADTQTPQHTLESKKVKSVQRREKTHPNSQDIKIDEKKD